MERPGRVRPILKWPGGKFRVLGALLPLLPPGRRLVEPFVGSGAVFLNTDYPAYLLCDVNPDLIDFYAALVDGGDKFVDACRALFAGGNDASVYYERRERFNELPLGPERAALFLYLNRHGYNGLVRYNAARRFNVPFGQYARPHFPGDEMRRFADKARDRAVAFRCADFRDTFRQVEAGDTVYCDPPYAPLSETANFTAYAGLRFGPDEQRELADWAERAAAAGAAAAISNHDLEVTRALYRHAAAIHSLTARRSISRNGAGRETVAELVAVFRKD